MAKKVIKPRIRGFICTSAHPEGCAENVRRQVAAVESAGFEEKIGTALIVGASTGYGLSSLLTATFGYGAKTVAVCFEKPPSEKKTATAGWYNLAEAKRLADEKGLGLETINGDAFSNEVKQEAIERLRALGGPVDLVIYSLASPRRKDPDSDTVWSSELLPIGEPYTGKSIDVRDDGVTEVTLEPAEQQHIDETVRVMGGDDWRLWIEALRDAGMLADDARTVAYSYIGPEVTHPLYRAGTIGRAKEHLEATAKELDDSLEAGGGGAWVSVNKAIVTQSSTAIPAVPLYISLLYRVMKDEGTHEGPIEQAIRLMKDHLGPGRTPKVDDEGRIRLDDLEMKEHVQVEVGKRWDEVTSENLPELSDWEGFKLEFRQLFGFDVDGIDYDAETEVDRPL